MTFSGGGGSCGTEPYQKGPEDGFVCCDPGCPLGFVNRPGLREGPPPAFVWPWLQSAAADLVIMLLKRISRGPQ